MNGSSKRRGIVVGFPYFGRYLAKLINEQSSSWKLQYIGDTYISRLRGLIDLRHCDVLISFGGPAPDPALAEAARYYNVPIVVIWAGSDVLNAGSDPGMLEIIKDDGYINVAVAAWLVDELAAIGIDATYNPVTGVETPAQAAPLPREFRVVTYLPEPRRAFYGEKNVYAIARECRDITFNVIGEGSPNSVAPPNVRFLGYVRNMESVLDSSTVLLRLPEHDGKSMLVLEALARGRHVIWTHEFPGVHNVSSVTGAINVLRELQREHQQGTLGVNQAGMEFVRNEFSRAKVASRFEEVLDRAVCEGNPTLESGKKSVVISGFALFGAKVARAARWAAPSWDPLVLRSGTRLSRLISGIRLMKSDVWYCIGTPIPDRWLHLVAQLTRKRRVIHWVGSDVECLKTDRAVRSLCSRDNVRHLAEADWMVDELAAHGVRASVAPLPPQVSMPDEIPPLPETFTVLFYVPRWRSDFYGRREYERLFRHFLGRPIKFIVVGGGTVFVPPGADVENIGWQSDLRDVYARTSALMRFTRHDGLSLMALEALSYGRHLIWSQKFPFSSCARTYADCESAVEHLLELHLRGELQPQADASRYIQESYDVRRCVERIATFWDTAPSSAVLPFATLEAHR